MKIPAIQLPKDISNANMVRLIVYNGKIYTQSATEIDASDAKDLLDVKLGKTKETIDEWSEQEDYNEEFASTVGVSADVYSVQGYDKDFRIMIYEERGGNIYAEFYENLNGITINNGEDIFGQLNMIGNVSTAQWRTFSDWDNGVENYNPIEDTETLNSFIEILNKAKPLPAEENADQISNSRSDGQFREITINLNDGSKVRLILLKNGYIHYGSMDVYFKVEDEIISKIWKKIAVICTF